MTLEEYKEIYSKDETEYIELTRELVEAWLDDKIEAKKQARAIMQAHDFSLCGGAFIPEDGEFAIEICPCGFVEPDNCYLFIHRGIEYLAAIIGAKLERKRHGGKYRWYYSFDYKGVKIYEISNEDLTDEN
jgi:hypothetical protein